MVRFTARIRPEVIPLKKLLEQLSAVRLDVKYDCSTFERQGQTYTMETVELVDELAAERIVREVGGLPESQRIEFWLEGMPPVMGFAPDRLVVAVTLQGVVRDVFLG